MKQLTEFPRLNLGVFPTPLQKLENLSREFEKNIYLKRDDLTGVGLGGNKVRKLEFLLADAQEKGAQVVMTTGQAQSNHAMLTAACANAGTTRAMVVGGVASSVHLRKLLRQRLARQRRPIEVYFGDPRYSADNAAGVAAIGMKRFLNF